MKKYLTDILLIILFLFSLAVAIWSNKTEEKFPLYIDYEDGMQYVVMVEMR